MVNRNVSPSDEDYYRGRSVRNVSWSLFAGAFIALATEAVLCLLGQFIGFAIINSPVGATPLVGFGSGSTVWWGATFIVSLFVGGWFAGRLAGIPDRAVGSWNGLASWGFAMLVLLAFLATPLGTTIGGSLNVLNRASYTAAGAIMVPTVAPSMGAGGVARGNTAAMNAARAGLNPVRAQRETQGSAVAAFIMMIAGAFAAAAGGASGAPKEPRPSPYERGAVYERTPVEATRESETPVIR